MPVWTSAKNGRSVTRPVGGNYYREAWKVEVMTGASADAKDMRHRYLSKTTRQTRNAM